MWILDVDPRSFGLPQSGQDHPAAQGLGAAGLAVLGRQVLARQGRAKVAVVGTNQACKLVAYPYI